MAGGLTPGLRSGGEFFPPDMKLWYVMMRWWHSSWWDEESIRVLQFQSNLHYFDIRQLVKRALSCEREIPRNFIIYLHNSNLINFSNKIFQFSIRERTKSNPNFPEIINTTSNNSRMVGIMSLEGFWSNQFIFSRWMGSLGRVREEAGSGIRERSPNESYAGQC